MKIRVLCLTALMAAAMAVQAEAGLVFNFNAAPGMSAQAIQGFAAAGARWSGLFSDNITVNIDVDFRALSPGVLGSASSTQATYGYSTVRNALVADKTSADDNTATANLQGGTNFNMLINRTGNNPNGGGSSTPYLDNTGANTSTIRMTNANAKALGLLSGTSAAVDASIAFSSSFGFDFDPSDGITAGLFDFIGIATHEIGHALGFISGVDVLDINNPVFLDDQFTYVSTLDLYRYSSRSAAVGAIDWTAGDVTSPKYFSLDGGATNAGATFSTGRVVGDGNQASHWKDNLGLGIMDPTAAPGELLAISGMDIRAFDVIGYNLITSPVPEPASVAMWALGALGLTYARRKRRHIELGDC